MGFSPKVQEDAMVACGRHCCLCHRFCGIKIEIHHIKPRSEGGPDTFENAIPLCFDCHADMRTYDAKHPKGKKYSEGELKRLRDNWYEKIRSSGAVLSANSNETDKAIYRALLEVLPWNGSLSFISSNNFAGWSFHLDRLNQLHNFQALCENPAFEFIDTDIESLRSALLKEIHFFQRLIGHNTFPTMIAGMNQVPPEWERQNPTHFNKVVSDIHNSAELICNYYQQLIRVATRKLGVLPSFT